MADITLTSAMRANLVSLQSTTNLLGRTQERLASGLKVNSAVDNPASFFAARGHNQRADLLNGLKDNIGEAIQTLKAADNGVTGVLSTIEALRGIVTQARSALNDTVNSATTIGGGTTGSSAMSGGLVGQYNRLVEQLNFLVADSGYKGVNFLTSGSVTLTVNLNENATSTIVMSGFNAGASGLQISGYGTTATSVGGGSGMLNWTDLDSAGELDKIETSLNKAIATLQSRSSELAANLNTLTIRQSFITDMVNTLKDGATALTVADTNEEGANLLILQTRQQLGTTALSLSSQAAQSVLRLFG